MDVESADTIRLLRVSRKWSRKIAPAADLAHGGKPISLEHTRRSIVTRYCPRDVAPLYFEGGPRRIWRHRSGNSFTTLL